MFTQCSLVRSANNFGSQSASDPAMAELIVTFANAGGSGAELRAHQDTFDSHQAFMM